MSINSFLEKYIFFIFHCFKLGMDEESNISEMFINNNFFRTLMFDYLRIILINLVYFLLSLFEASISAESISFPLLTHSTRYYIS